MLGDVREREVVARERDEEDRRRDERRGERGDERVLRREREPAALAPGGVRAREERVRDEAEGEEERCAPERGHYVLEEDFAGA